MKWIYLLLSIICEVAGTVCLKLSSTPGPHTFYYGVSVFVLYCMCFFFLGYAMKYFEVGVIYAIWSGMGTCLIALIGVLFFGDSISVLKVISLLMVVLGIVGLHLSKSGL